MNENEIDTYLKGITRINSALGKVDALRLYVNTKYNDSMADSLINAIIKDLSTACGVKYEPINMEYLQPKKEIEHAPIIETKTISKPQPEKEKFNIVDAVLNNEKKEVAPKSEIIIENNQSDVIKFKNSTHLDFMMYNKSAKVMVIGFVNGRTYKYFDVPIYHYDNLININDSKGSVGGYFNQNIRNKYRYKEITDDILIG